MGPVGSDRDGDGTGVFFGVGVIGQLAFGTLQSSPALHKLPTILAGIASLVVIVLLVQSDTRVYFAAVRSTKAGTLPPVSDRAPATRAARGARPARSAGARPSAGRVAPPTGAWAPRAGGLGALFRRSVGSATPTGSSTDGSPSADVGPADAATVDRPTGTPARRSTATRPGSVKAKGGGVRPGRSKSRQQ